MVEIEKDLFPGSMKDRHGAAAQFPLQAERGLIVDENIVLVQDVRRQQQEIGGRAVLEMVLETLPGQEAGHGNVGPVESIDDNFEIDFELWNALEDGNDVRSH